jgi:hypothetical protein
VSIGTLDHLPQIEINGIPRVLGWVPPTDAQPTLMSALPQLPQDAWQEFEFSGVPTVVKDQGSYGACNGHAAASTLELCRWIGIGTASAIELSAWFVYAKLCGGWDRGSNIGDALVLMQGTGTCLDTYVPHGTINPNRLSTQAKADAQNHKIALGGKLESWDDICNAVQLRRPCNISVTAGRNWSDVDANGVPPVNPGLGNHAVAVGWGMRRTANGDWQIKMQNSWSTKWGVGGYCWLTRAHWETQNGREAYFVEASTVQPGTEPPVVLI